MRPARIACIAALALTALATAQSGRAGSSWSAEATCMPPCFDVAVIVEGSGHVSGTALGSTIQPSGIECAPTNGLTCESWFIFLDAETGVLLTPTPDAGETFLGWEPGGVDYGGCPELVDEIKCKLTIATAPGAFNCVKAVFTGSGSSGACSTLVGPGIPPCSCP